LHRRHLIQSGAALAAGALLGAAGDPAGPTPFDGATVRRLAQALSKQPYAPPDTGLPGPVDHLTYEQYRTIAYKPDRALWRDGNLPFQVQFFPRGFLYRPAVEVFEVAAGQAARVAYSPDLFDWPDPAMRLPDLGFAGFRIHARLNRPDVFTEAVVFLGASYFRAVAKDQVYGLSARGLAIGTGNPRGEEFARFRSFWLERPGAGAGSMVVHALLDTASTTGAYRFTIRPGETTVFDVESVLYPRTDIIEPGLAPLTSMYLFGPADRPRDDWRPAVHDNDALQMWTGRDEALWRPLANPVDLQVSAFGDSNPRGFGLMQRARAFADYQDLEAQYGRRPGMWIEPIGDWGGGAVTLVEIPTANETNDNIVAFWRPKEPLRKGGEYSATYRMHWVWDTPVAGKLARIAATRSGAVPGGRVFVLDIVGDPVKGLPSDAKVRPDISASAGKVGGVFSVPNSETGGWRVSFELQPDGAKLSELRCVLLGEAGPLSETWLYRWTA
jgi:glucans biosynthesis protein